MKTKLAIHGGTPVRSNMLQYGRQFIDENDIQLVVECLKSDYLTTGPMVERFEQKLKEITGAKYAVAVSNCTTGLHISLLAAGIGTGDEVITTPFTFAATANAVRYCGAIPVFADINPHTCLIDPKEIEGKITPKTKAIIPVHYSGEICDMDAICAIAKKHGLAVIEDAAHAIGSKYKGRAVGSLSDMTVFSFHPVKTVTTGEGGAVTTNNPELYEKLIRLRSHGITRKKDLMMDKNQGDWYYEQLELGNNYRLTDMQCALGIGQLEKLPFFQERRAVLVDRYNKILTTWDNLRILQSPEDSEATRHLYPVQIVPQRLKTGRKEIYEALKAEGIGVNVHYIPVYFFPDYQKLGYKKGLCPIAEQVYENLITLPLYPTMTDEDFDDVINALEKVFSYYTNV